MTHGGIVEICRKTFVGLPSIGKSMCEDSVCLELRKNVDGNPEEHQEDRPFHS